MSLKLEGVKDLDKALKAMATTTAKGTARRAMQKALEPVAEAARAGAPRASGKLIESIGVSAKLTKRQAKLSRKAVGKDELTMHVGATGRHAHLVEFGTGPRYHKKSGKFVGVMPPQPFMRPAWDANRQGVLGSLADHLSSEISKTLARSAARKARKAK